MNDPDIQIGLRENRRNYQPGDEITGAVRWEFDNAPRDAKVHLCWYTKGKGTEDTEIVETITFDEPQAGDVRTFSFKAPASPYSFSGKLISLIWCVEVLLEPKKRFAREDIVIAPDAKEVVLPSLD